MTRHVRPPSFTKAQRFDVATTYGAVILCQACGFALYVSDMVIDHHQAVIDGGAHELDNWRPLCFGCNSRKGAIEHKNNAKAKRLAKKHSGQDEATPRAKARAIPSRPWPESTIKKIWPSREIPARPFQRREG